MKRILPAVLASFLYLLVSPSARADLPTYCADDDADCKRLVKALTGPNFVPLQIDGGVRYGEGGLDGAVRFSVSGAAFDIPIGDLDVLTFDAIYVPNAGGVRIRFSLAESEVLFFCKDEEGKTHPPLMGIAMNCTQDGLFGIGGSILENQSDTATGRWAARWAELNAVVNFLRNGNSIGYLQKRLNGFLGASVDTVWPGDLPGGAKTIARLNVGVSGMVRTVNNRWEVSGYAGYRPNVTAWDDYAIEARAKIMHHLMLSRNTMADIGLTAEYSRWTKPQYSVGDFASDRDRDSLFVGLLFGVTFH